MSHHVVFIPCLCKGASRFTCVCVWVCLISKTYQAWDHSALRTGLVLTLSSAQQVKRRLKVLYKDAGEDAT